MSGRGGCAFKTRFPLLFRICRESGATVEEIITGSRTLTFRRNLGVIEREELSDLLDLTASARLPEESDLVVWSLEKSCKFSTRSLYRFMVSPGCVDLRMVDIWNTRHL